MKEKEKRKKKKAMQMKNNKNSEKKTQSGFVSAEFSACLLGSPFGYGCDVV